MTSPVLSVEQIRVAESAALRSTPEPELMARAASAVASALRAELVGVGRPVENSRIVVLAGRGNNGADAMLAAAELGHEGAQVTVVAVADALHERARAACERIDADIFMATAASGLRAAHAALAESDAVIDGIVGLGSRAGLGAPADGLVSSIADGTLVIAVDVPSGLDPDSGEISGLHVTADVTVTFIAMKRCLVDQPAASAAGRVIVDDLGIVP